jgi:nicotinic acid mononucleotide adenylyltransferase
MRMAKSYDQISATALREKIRQGGAWEEFTPEAIHDRVLELYG